VNAGEGARRRGIDPDDTGVRVGTLERLAVERAGQRDVGGVLGDAADLFSAIDA
jgi:hypothetical protein